MPAEIIQTPPTSLAATKETEPEVVAGISSAEGNPDMPLSFRIGGLSLGTPRIWAVLAFGVALGCGAAWLLRRPIS